MPSNVRVKICGLKRPEEIAAAVDAGAGYIGFVHFAKSPRHLELDVIRELAIEVPPGIARVLLTVDPDDDLLDAIATTLPIDVIQLHGAETPERVSEIRHRLGLPVMKAVGVADAADLPRLDAYEAVADMLLVDARPPKGASRPGGNGIAFDWRLLAGREWAKPWMLAGGLSDENVAQAIRLTGARQVDVSTGIESAPGVKDIDRIAAFVAAALA
jgi:phosphoribosylanthranilate isomerase